MSRLLIHPAVEAARPKTRVAVSVPCGTSVASEFAFDLARMMAWTAANRPDLELHMQFNSASLLIRQRRELVLDAIAKGCTHVLFLDSDMRFPRDTMARLVDHREPIVAVTYSRRGEPILPVAAIDAAETLLYLEGDEAGLLEVFYTGFGVMLLDLDLFRALPQPWFCTPTTLDGEVQGEDVYFCLKAKKFGTPTLVDLALSQEIEHVGAFTYTHATTRAYREGMREASADGAH